ncbi:MAG: inositol monophosphatase family protein [Thiotrichales bacterium]|nr:inositol monophosphatase family protein [Thiotrichales bacterium]
MIKHPFSQVGTWQLLKNGLRRLGDQEMRSRFRQVSFQEKQDGSLLTEADLQMQKHTQHFLRQHWPEFAFLGEEMTAAEQEAALQNPFGCWVFDPVDGTSNFASGIPVYSASLALLIQGRLVVGLVYDPDRDELFAARLGQGAELNDQQLIAKTAKKTLKQTSGLIDFKRLEPELAIRIIQDNPYGSQRSFGSVALDWCWVAAGRGHLYLHGSQHLWDYAAGYLILHEAGGQSCTLDGESVFTAKVQKRSAVAATTPELFEQWQSYLQIPQR